jgi:hypothetical protein
LEGTEMCSICEGGEAASKVQRGPRPRRTSIGISIHSIQPDP